MNPSSVQLGLPFTATEIVPEFVMPMDENTSYKRVCLSLYLDATQYSS